MTSLLKYNRIASQSFGRVVVWATVFMLGPLATTNGAAEPDKIIDEFIAAFQKNEQLTDLQRAQVLDIVGKLRNDEFARSMTVTEALREIYPPYRIALNSLGEEQLDAAVEQLGKIVDSKDPYLAADASYFLARAHILAEHYEQALPLLIRVLGSSSEKNLHGGNAQFLKGISQVNLLQNKEAAASLSHFIKQYPNAPERMRVTAMQRLEVLNQIEEGELNAAFQRMEYSRRRLALQDPGKQTQAQQEMIIDMLAKLIEKAEERESQSQGQGQNQQQQQKEGSGQKKESGKDGQGDNKQDQGDAMRRIYRRGPQSPWSSLRDRDRDPAFSAIKSKFPARYQQLIEQYYKSFQDEQK